MNMKKQINSAIHVLVVNIFTQYSFDFLYDILW